MQAYVWLDSTKALVLPEQLAQPFMATANLLHMPPVMTYAAYVLLNCKLCAPAHGFDHHRSPLQLLKSCRLKLANGLNIRVDRHREQHSTLAAGLLTAR